MHVLIVNHDVEDYERWKAGYDAFPPSVGGARSASVNRNVDNPNNVTVVSAFDTLEEAIAFRDNPDLKDGMAVAGVVGVPRIELLEEVESAQY